MPFQKAMLGISPVVSPKQRLSPFLVDIHWRGQGPPHTHRSEASGGRRVIPQMLLVGGRGCSET